MRTLRTFRRALIASAAASLALAASAGAATIQVTSNLDDGTACTLREALASAEGDADSGGCTGTVSAYGNDTITFNPASFPPAPVTPTVIQTMGGEYVITGAGDLDIDGPGMDALEIRATAGANRIFNMNSGGQDIFISGLSATMVNASGSSDFQGGAITNSANTVLVDVRVAGNTLAAATSTPGASAEANGAGIHNGAAGTLILDSSVVEDNLVTAANTAADPFGAAAVGAGVYSEGALSIQFSTIDDNDAMATDSGTGNAQVLGAGVRSVGTVEVDHSTISRNQGSSSSSGTGGFAIALGGGMHVASGGGLVELSTVAENSLSATASMGSPITKGGGLLIDGVLNPLALVSDTIARNGAATGANIQREAAAASDVPVQNTIIADPVGGANCGATLMSNGFNIDFPDTDVTFPGTCGLGMGTDLTSNPLLDLNLQDNGGETETIALLTGSPAIDAGSNAMQSVAFATEDQRELTRPSNFAASLDAANGSDIGAFELQAPAPPPPGAAPPPPAAGPTGQRAAALKRCAKIKNKKKKRKCKKRARQLPV